MPKMTVTKQEALRVLELDGTSPSAADIQMHYQKLALKFHPTRRGANLQSIERFDRLCRSYLILTEGRESMTKLLSQAEMLDVFVKAFELEGMRIKKEATAEDASTHRKTKGAVPKSSVSSGGVIPKTPNKSTEDVVTRSRKLAREGYEMCNLGRHKDAVELFTQAIKLYAQEHSYFGNRSYCYSILGKYDKALKDAEKAIGLQPQLAKGYFRRAKAQLGLQKYTEAAESFKRVLEIDPTCLEARTELRSVHVFEIMSMGFTQEQAEWSLTHGNEDVQTAINILCGPDAVVPDVKMNPCNMDGFRSLWVGNIQPEVTEKMLTDLFRRYGDVHSIRILHDRHCAFINYGNKLSPGKAMEALQGHVLCGTAILIRFPDNNYLENGSKKDPVTVLRKSSLKMSAEEHKAASASSESKAKVSGPVNGNECYFWRTTGCSYGDNCYYEHIPSHKGIDWKAQRSNGKFK
ncbi:hypothetical protein MTO96_021236 [Rhipicephalus appendiculatus]